MRRSSSPSVFAQNGVERIACEQNESIKWRNVAETATSAYTDRWTIVVIISNCSFPLVSVTVHRTLTYAWVRRRHIKKLFGAELMRMGLDDTDLCVDKRHTTARSFGCIPKPYKVREHT